MKPFYQTNDLAGGIYYATLVTWIVLELIGRASHQGPAGAPRATDRGTRILVLLTAAGGIVGASLVANRATGTAFGGPRWLFLGLGVGVMWAGIALRQWSIRVLGRYFTYEVAVQEGQEVVSTGPYRVVRHPSYSGILLIVAGIGLALGSWLSLVIAFVVPLIGILCRIRVEEAALRSGLGSAYERYAQGRRRLVPGVW